MNTVIIVQARMGSERFPGKIMADIAGKPMLERVVERLEDLDATLVVATTFRKEDDDIIHLCEKHRWQSFRGNELNVLDRYLWAARQYDAEIVVRITGDCPLVNPSIVQGCVEKLKAAPATDYISNTIDRTYARGLDVEVFWMDTLERLNRMADSDAEREHVTQGIHKKRGLWLVGSVTDRENNSDLRWCVDTKADLDVVRTIYNNLGGTMKYRDLVKMVRGNPLMTTNSNIFQKLP